MKVLATSGKWLFVVCVPFLLVTAGIWWAANSHWLYTSGFEKHDVVERTGLEAGELDKVAEGMIAYFSSPDEYVELTVVKDDQLIELFTEEEQIHFSDVKRLFRLDYWVFLGTGVYVIGYAAWNLYRRSRRQLIGTVFTGGWVTLAALGLLGIGVLIDFNWLWLQFHHLIFSNDFWSARGYMLQLFPSGFWVDAVTYCVAAAGGVAAGLASVTGGWLWWTRRTAGR